ncbi:urate hydroxylase PuuD [Aquabacterium sp. J223]|uniref:urate hydroxylase PuuD n=1 Tax=Aquabacterium sp. J223 TaxID=2898431 RepID=UPI0021ADFBEE|nr:urate hydroxylase PuuD [Aquabacterium sp. J223]UUX95562.1 urate hydroxylase PuuD [Aquabacterium sp. J223]
MDAYLLDWANLLLRWLHVVAAIAWIGSSFYFVFLDNHLHPPEGEDLKAKGVDGELWAVHGGGFYNPQKYNVGPKQMPKGTLHWFYWEGHVAWLSGFALFSLLYLWNASSFLVDARVFAWSSPALAAAAAIAFLVVGFVVYDVICRVFGRNADGSVGGGNADLRVAALVFVYVVAAAWLACQLFAGRAAFLIVGAMLATTMSANVAMWIIPGQRKVVADLTAGRRPDPIHGQRGKQRSVHNTYFTLPVLVAMLSNHYGQFTNHPHNWLLLVGLMLLGALVRAYFVRRHKKGHSTPLMAASLALLALIVWAARPAPTPPAPPVAADASPPTLAQVQAVVNQRCVMCHNADMAQKNVRLHTPDLLVEHAQAMVQQVVVTRAMPLNNATQITEEERALIGRWVKAGAPAK